MTALSRTSPGTGGNSGLPRADVLAAALVSVLAGVLFCQNSAFPLGVHPDEPKKVAFILSGRQDFMHPILMLQVSRLANLFAGFTDPEEVVLLGRAISILCGGLFVFSSYVLIRQALASSVLAFLAAAGMAITPLVHIHAQVLKEDIYLAAVATPALIFLVRYADRPTLAHAVLSGALAGLTASAKHAGILMLALPLLVPAVCRVPQVRTYWARILAVFAAAAAVYVSVNLPALLEFGTSVAGLNYEIEHVSGRIGGISVSALETKFVHNLREGLMQGMGAVFALTGVAGMALAAVRWKTADNSLRIPWVFAAIWYLAHELVPMKIGASRYMVPLAPVMALFAGYLLCTLLRPLRTRFAPLAAGTALVAFALVPARITFAYAFLSEPDTSSTAASFAESLGGKVFLDRGMPVARRGNLPRLNQIAGQAQSAGERPARRLLAGWDYVVTGNVKGIHYTSDKALFAAVKTFFADLYGQGYIEIRHAVRSYEFKNRGYRIVDVHGNGSLLRERAEKWPWPDSLKVTFKPAGGTGPVPLH